MFINKIVLFYMLFFTVNNISYAQDKAIKFNQNQVLYDSMNVEAKLVHNFLNENDIYLKSTGELTCIKRSAQIYSITTYRCYYGGSNGSEYTQLERYFNSSYKYFNVSKKEFIKFKKLNIDNREYRYRFPKFINPIFQEIIYKNKKYSSPPTT